jgi:hypothetical protein
MVLTAKALCQRQTQQSRKLRGPMEAASLVRDNLSFTTCPNFSSKLPT